MQKQTKNTSALVRIKFFLFLLTIVCSAFNANAQTLQWEYTLTVSGRIPSAGKMATHSTGSYSAGTENNPALRKVLRLLKLSPSGAFLYSNSFTFGTAVTTLDINKILVDASGNCYVLMETNNTTSGGIDTWLFSYSSSLAFRWATLINFDVFDRAADLSLTTTGKILAMVNYTPSASTTVAKNVGIKRLLTSSGATDLTINFTSSYNKQAVRMVSDAAGGIVLCGRNYLTPADHQAMIVKYSATGSYQWARYFTYSPYVSGNLRDFFRDMVIDNASNVFAVGGGGNFTGLGQEGYVKKYNGTTGADMASHYYSTPGNDFISHARIDGSGNITVAGETVNPNSVFFRRLNNSLSTVQATGTRNLSTTIFLPVSNFFITDFLLNPNGSVVFAYFSQNGATISTYYTTLLKLNSSGGLVFENSFNATPRQLCAAPPTNFPNNEFLLLFNPNITTGTSNWKIRKYTSPASRFANDELEEFTTENISPVVFPNPAATELTIENSGAISQIQLFDMQGKMYQPPVINSEIFDSSQKIKLNVSQLPNGVYFINTVGKTESKTTRLVIQH